MGEIIKIIENRSGGKCFSIDRYSLDHFIMPEFQDKDEEFRSDRIFETTNHSGKNRQIDKTYSSFSLFKYFLDGSRRTYKIADFASTDGKFLPIVGGQIGAAVCTRKRNKIIKYKLKRQNILAVPDRFGDEFESISAEVLKFKKLGLSIDKLVQYRYKAKPEKPFEYLAIAKIQLEMRNMEVELITDMVTSNKLDNDKILMIDGSLMFSGIKEQDEYIFANVIGISKTFNPNIKGILRRKSKEIGSHLANLRFGERTPVFKYEIEGRRRENYQIGAWYLRLRNPKFSRSPLEGIIKIEKIATTLIQKENGFDSDMIDNISASVLLERNVTCYGRDKRWANHLYPIYLTEFFVKNSFVSDKFFVNIF